MPRWVLAPLPANALDVNGSLAVGTYAGTATGASNELIVSGNVGIGSTSPVASLDLSQKTDAVALPAGTIIQRPGSPVNGMIRYDSSGPPAIEAYVNGSWTSLLTSTGSISLTLGTSATTTNPQRSGEADTGLFSANSGQVSVAVNVSGTGTDVMDVS